MRVPAGPAPNRRSGTDRGRGWVLAAVAVVGLGGPVGASAQAGAGGAPTPLTLDEAIRRAEATNPAYRRTVNDLERTQIETRQFWLGFLPQPRINLLSTNMQWNRQSFGVDNFGNPVANPDFRMVQSASSQQGASLNFQLNLQDLFRRRMDRATGEIREIAVAQGGQNLASDIRLDYLNAQERTEALELEVDLLEVRRVNHQITEDLFRLAQVNRPELLNSEIDLLDQEQQIERSRADLGTALLQLRNRIGDPELGEISIEPTALRVFDPTLLGGEAIVQAAVEAGPRVRREELGLRRSETEVAVNRAAWLPSLTFSAATDRRETSRDSGTSFFQPVPDGEWSRTLSLSLAFPDLGQFLNRNAAGQATSVGIRNAQETLRETRFAVEEEVRGVLLDLTSAYATIEIQDQRTLLAEERLQIEQERYRLGQGDYRDLQSSAESAANARRQALEARYAFERALIRLERSLGAPVEIP